VVEWNWLGKSKEGEIPLKTMNPSKKCEKDKDSK